MAKAAAGKDRGRGRVRLTPAAGALSLCGISVMRLSEVLLNVPAVRQDADPATEISGLAYDSRRVEPGFLFCAVPGFKADGHDFVAQARAKGAASVLTGRWLDEAGLPQVETANVRRSMALAAANFHGHPSQRMKVVGVTGTNGKTTTTYLIDAILRSGRQKTGLVGGIEYRIGEESAPAARTTPESIDLQQMLAGMAQAGVEAATLEVSSHGIDLYRLAFVDFDVAVFTNLTREHLDLHGEMESYYISKRRLFTEALEDSESESGVRRRPLAVVNLDDAYGRRLAGELGEALGFGLSAGADITAENVKMHGWETSFDLVTPSGAAPVTLNLPGYHNLSNALAAAAAAHALGLDPQVSARGLLSVAGVPGRFELLDVKAPFKVVIDYAHNEDGLARSLSTAAELTDHKVIVVFGCPGERDREKRPEMGRIAGSSSDLAILTTDDCYGEPPEQILDEAEPGLLASGGRYLRIPDRREAIEAALQAAGPGDTVLIAGKGHETRQIMSEGPLPFSDSLVVREIMAPH